MGDFVKKRIGLFGGTFNPIHFGHINLSLDLKEKNELDEVWLIPSLSSPLRVNEKTIPPSHRLAMLELAVKDIPGFFVSDIELKRPSPSYTIDTIKEMQTAYPEHSFFLLCGEDSLLRFLEWKEPLEIIRRIRLLIGSRYPSELVKRMPTLGFNEELTCAVLKGITPTRQLEISATDIRERLKKRLYCGHLVPGKVLDYIYQNQLYFTPQS